MAVLDGPTLLGSEIGDRIAQGLLLALNAVASGKKTLQLSGHSRGAVETMLVIHELARVKEELEKYPTKSLRDILVNSPCQYTRLALNKVFNVDTAEDTPENRTLLLARLKVLKTQAILFDAVPGDIPGFSWHDPRFYKKLPCDDHLYFISRDERTPGFYPIIAENMNVIVVPGHHGSITGNVFTQSLSDLPESLRQYSTSSVQDLVLCKWLHFVNHTTGAFSQAKIQEHLPLRLNHHELDTVLNTYLTADELERNQILLNHYLKVAKDDPAYQYFKKTYYPHVPSLFNFSDHRLIHLHNDRFTKAGDVFQDMRGAIAPRPMYTERDTEEGFRLIDLDDGAPFVNIDHVKLYLNKYLTENKTKETDMELVALFALLDNLLQAMRHSNSNSMQEDTPLEHKLLALMSNDSGRHQFFHSLSAFVESIGQKYFHEQLEGKENSNLFLSINATYSILAEAKDQDFTKEQRDILNEFEAILQDNMRKAIESHFMQLIQQSDEMLQEIDFHLTDGPHGDKTPQPLIDRYLINSDQLYCRLEWMKQNYQPLINLVGEIGMAVNLERIDKQCERLLKATGSILIKNEHLLKVKLEHLSTDFHKKVKDTLSFIEGKIHETVSAAHYAGSLFNHKKLSEPTPTHPEQLAKVSAEETTETTLKPNAEAQKPPGASN